MVLSKRYIISLLLLVGLFGSAGFAVNNFYNTSIEATEDVFLNEYKDRQKTVTNSIASELETHINLLVEKMTLLAKFDEIVGGDAEKCSESLREKIGLINLPIANLSRVNTDGIFYCSVSESTIGRDSSDFNYINRLLSGESKGEVYSRALIRVNNQGNNDTVIAVHVPVYDGDEFVGTLGGAFFMSDMIASISNSILNIPPGGWLIVLDDNGDVLYHKDLNLIGKNIYKESLNSLQDKESGFNDVLKSATQVDNYSNTYYTIDGTLNYGHVKFANLDEQRHFSVLVTVPLSYVDSALSRTTAYSANTTLAIILLVFFSVIILFLLFVTWNKALKSEIDQTQYKLMLKIDEADKIRYELNESIKQLSKNNKELEKQAEESKRLNKLMVQRELKMADLKKKNKKDENEVF